jgi:hypothetical protein
MDRYGHLLPGLDDALAAGLDAAYTGTRARTADESATDLQVPREVS